jgi:AraC-like DNA-binding protein
VAQTRRFIEIFPAGRSGFISVRFRHGGGCHFMRPAVSAFADGLAGTRDLWGPEAVELESLLGEARSAEARVGLVERFLFAQLARHYKPEVDRLAAALWRRPGSQRVADLCRDLCVSERRLERTVKAALGQSPKQALTLARFLRACALLRRAVPATLADVAQACGYYDQAHFNGDFKRLSGMTPLQFAADRAVAVLDVG